ncbi:hypothetical protein ES332_A03G016700v1 [Gossypium tomentosum]|uniref:Uncharacterized protein n=1 Tax=Gossypium tomentosum TaxID=34277 RepID=A0A5D2R291_GOSTO|nr:hypothetical protein ES332_A03G016700v1 [Gossypium tomentosum]
MVELTTYRWNYISRKMLKQERKWLYHIIYSNIEGAKGGIHLRKCSHLIS